MRKWEAGNFNFDDRRVARIKTVLKRMGWNLLLRQREDNAHWYYCLLLLLLTNINN